MPIPLDRTYNTITPEEWLGATIVEQRAFDEYWRKEGVACFSCTRCGFPSAYGTVGCDACRNIKTEWETKPSRRLSCPTCHAPVGFGTALDAKLRGE